MMISIALAAPDDKFDPKTVLVVEDESLLLLIAAEFLENAGFSVLEAESPAAALKLLAAGKEIDVIFTEVQMPGEIDGLEFAHLVKNSWSKIGILITSGATFPNVEELPLGSRFLSKPYAQAHVIRHIRDLAGV